MWAWNLSYVVIFILLGIIKVPKCFAVSSWSSSKAVVVGLEWDCGLS
jgi:hypothetical protein